MKKISLQPVDHITETQVPLSILREDLRIGPNCVKDCLALPLSTDRPMRKRPGAASIIPSAVRGGRRTAASAELALSPRPTPSTPSIDCDGEWIAFIIVSPTTGVVTIVALFENELQEDAMILLAAVADCFQEAQQFVEACLAQGKN